MELTLIPGGGLFFTESTDAEEPSFGNYNLGGAFVYNINRYFGLEAEVGGTFGIEQASRRSGRKHPVETGVRGGIVGQADARLALACQFLEAPFRRSRPSQRGLVELGDHLAAVRHQDLFTRLDQAQVFAQPVLELAHSDGLHKSDCSYL